MYISAFTYRGKTLMHETRYYGPGCLCASLTIYTRDGIRDEYRDDICKTRTIGISQDEHILSAAISSGDLGRRTADRRTLLPALR